MTIRYNEFGVMGIILCFEILGVMIIRHTGIRCNEMMSVPACVCVCTYMYVCVFIFNAIYMHVEIIVRGVNCEALFLYSL